MDRTLAHLFVHLGPRVSNDLNSLGQEAIVVQSKQRRKGPARCGERGTRSVIVRYRPGAGYTSVAPRPSQEGAQNVLLLGEVSRRAEDDEAGVGLEGRRFAAGGRIDRRRRWVGARHGGGMQCGGVEGRAVVPAGGGCRAWMRG